MTTTEVPLIVGEVIDLRSSTIGSDPVASSELADGRVGLERRRRLIIGIVLTLVAIVGWDLVAGRIVHDQRQRHLAHEVTVVSTRISAGDALMVLQIPQIGLNQVVVEGAGSSELRGGPGHVEGSALPGQRGNIVVIGRKIRYGAPFSDLGDIVKGSTITVRTRAGAVRAYEVDRVRRVSTGSRAPLAPSATERLTLLTSAGGLVPDRLVMVSAKLVGGAAPSVAALTRSGVGSLDQRPTNSLVGIVLLLIVIAMMVLSIVFAGGELRRRYSPLPVAGVLLPVMSLLAVVVIFCIDVVVPATF